MSEPKSHLDYILKADNYHVRADIDRRTVGYEIVLPNCGEIRINDLQRAIHQAKLEWKDWKHRKPKSHWYRNDSGIFIARISVDPASPCSEFTRGFWHINSEGEGLSNCLGGYDEQATLHWHGQLGHFEFSGLHPNKET